MPQTYIFLRQDSSIPSTLLREDNEFGFRTLTLVDPPQRLTGDTGTHDAKVDTGIDYRRATPVLSPAQLLQHLPEGVPLLTLSRRSVARLYAYYLIAEDPQRRLDVRPVETLAHQVSLVSHVLQNEQLNYVLLADEVGLGKTIEAGLLLQELFRQNPALRVLYLAPARLVSNVFREFDRLGLNFRQWTAQNTDARLESDNRIIASIHRAVHGSNHEKVLKSPRWDVIIVDECHHLSAWSPEAGDPTQTYNLVSKLIRREPKPGRFMMMSGTPHQGHAVRFENLLDLLRQDKESKETLSGRVIYRTKDDVRGWDGQPLFPGRQVNIPFVIDLGQFHREWIQAIHDFYRPPEDGVPRSEARRRAAGWRCAQAMQWATSSPQAGLGYLARQAIRSGWTLRNPALKSALETMRPYRLGPEDEPLDDLMARIQQEVNVQLQDGTIDDIEEYTDGEVNGFPNAELTQLLRQGVELVNSAGSEKWQIMDRALLSNIGTEKVVLFAQPIETVMALSRYLKNKTGQKPALIIGGQTDFERGKEVAAFCKADGPQFLVSSKAGGEGINLQVAHRLIHVDVPWNPMDMEQRVGRVHRFGSRETIIVDTVVVKDSREADAYNTARLKLRNITEMLVKKERFEAVFSRVMALVPPEEFQEVLINEAIAPLNVPDQQALAEMVQRGYDRWKAFDDTYSEQQKAIRNQPGGMATWQDVIAFLEKNAGATRQTGYTRQSFVNSAKGAQPVFSDATVLTLDGKDYIASDYADALVYGTDGLLSRKLGLNIEDVAETLRKCAFATPSGPAYLKWGDSIPNAQSLPLGVLVFLRQTLQAGQHATWQESSTSLHAFVTRDDNFIEVFETEKSTLLRAIFQSTASTRPHDVVGMIDRLVRSEADLTEQLRRPTEDEFTRQIRHAVMPIFAGVIAA